MYYTYAYLREDGTPYYVGKGKKNRAYKKHQKAIITPKDKSRIIFLKKNLSEQEAFKHEIYMIAIFGRKDLGTGILHNKTNGGDGGSGPYMLGKNHTEETKIKISNVLKRKKIIPPTRKNAKHNQDYFGKVCKKTYEIISPKGEKTITNRMKLFCEENNLNAGGLYMVAKGEWKQWKGWTVKILSQ